jgi:hypothetical protein
VFCVVGEDSQPSLAHSPMALNDLNLALAPLTVVQIKKILYILSFHIRRDLIDQKNISRYCLFQGISLSAAHSVDSNQQEKARKFPSLC